MRVSQMISLSGHFLRVTLCIEAKTQPSQYPYSCFSAWVSISTNEISYILFGAAYS